MLKKFFRIQHISLALIFIQDSMAPTQYSFCPKAHKFTILAVQRILTDIISFPTPIAQLTLEYLRFDNWKQIKSWRPTHQSAHNVIWPQNGNRSPSCNKEDSQDYIMAIYNTSVASYFYNDPKSGSTLMKEEPLPILAGVTARLYIDNTLIFADNTAYLVSRKHPPSISKTSTLSMYKVAKDAQPIGVYESVKKFTTSSYSPYVIMVQKDKKQISTIMFNVVTQNENTIPINLKHPSAIALSPNGSLLIISNRNGNAELWDTKELKCVEKLKIYPRPRQLALSNKGQIAEILRGSLVIFPRDSNNSIRQKTADLINSPVFSHDGSILATVNMQAWIIEVRDGETGAVTHHLRSTNTENLVTSAFAISPDSNRIVNSTIERTMIIWEKYLTNNYDFEP